MKFINHFLAFSTLLGLLDLSAESINNCPESQRSLSYEIKENLSLNESVNCQETHFFTKESLLKKLKSSKNPLVTLYTLWNSNVSHNDDAEEDLTSHPLDLLNGRKSCSKESSQIQFLRLCQHLEIETRLSNVRNKNIYDFKRENEELGSLNLDEKLFYLSWDNRTLVSSEQLQDDPLLFMRVKQGGREKTIDFQKNAEAFAHFDILHPNSGEIIVFSGEQLHPQASFDNASIESDLRKQEKAKREATLLVTNSSPLFDHTAPTFTFKKVTKEEPETIWWQISNAPTFDLVASNLDRIVPYSSSITLDAVEETFINSNEPYYFRARGCIDGNWGDWSPVFAFEVEKPLPPTEIDFDKTDAGLYEINWERFAETTSEGEEDQAIDYLVFGSNAFDFIPSIYFDRQLNGSVNGVVVDEEKIENLVAITKEAKIQVKGHLAYYRIIARRKGQLSLPSSLVHVYDQGLIQQRNVLQLDECEAGQNVVKRMFFPVTESTPEVSFSFVSPSLGKEFTETPVDRLVKLSNRLADIHNPTGCPSHITSEIWEAIFPFLLPDNHPCKVKLDRLAAKVRFVLDPKTMKRNGFTRGERVGRWSRVCATPHVDMQKYYFKVYCDNEIYIKYDWKRWVHRCKGALLINDCIKRHKLQSMFKVPRKWIYVLPANPSPPNSTRYRRKNCILVCDNMRICEHRENERHYKKKMDHARLKGMYTLLQECGLYDSVFCFNMPFNKEGFICIIDTEYWHKWPVPFDRLSKNFSKENREYWQRLTRSGKIPDGVNSDENIPRNDRRDLSTVYKR